MISQPRHPLPLNKAACAFLPIVGVLLGFGFVLYASYSNSPYLRAKLGTRGNLVLLVLGPTLTTRPLLLLQVYDPLKSSPENSAQRHSHAFLPFSVGYRWENLHPSPSHRLLCVGHLTQSCAPRANPPAPMSQVSWANPTKLHLLQSISHTGGSVVTVGLHTLLPWVCGDIYTFFCLPWERGLPF